MDSYKLLTVAQVAKRLGVDDRTVRGWCAAGLLPGARQATRAGKIVWLVPEADLLEFAPSKPGVRPRRGRAARLGRYLDSDNDGDKAAA